MTQDTSLATYLANETVQKNIADVVGKNMRQFVTSVISLVGNDKSGNLAKCDRQSLLNACITAAALDLPINQNLGFAYVVPYKGLAQFQMGYKGFIQLAQRSGEIRTIHAGDVREGEYLGADRLTGEVRFSWIDDEATREKAKIVGYVGYFKTVTGFEKSLYMTMKELEKHAKRFSQTYKQGFGVWKDDFDAMAKKTVIKLLLSRFAPMNSQLAGAIEKDQVVLDADRLNYVDNEPARPEELAKEREDARLKKHIAEATTEAELMQVHQYCEGDEELMALYATKLNNILTGGKK